MSTIARSFLNSVRGFTKDSDAVAPSAANLPPRLATVAAGYAGVGDPTVTFDGEITTGTRTYKTLQPVRANERVVLLPVGRTYVILGTIGATVSPPAGAVIASASASADPGWLPCNGAAISRTDYAALFAAIGTIYGAGNGTTTFNVPDLAGRFPVGVAAPLTLGVATISIATPVVVTLPNILANGNKVTFTTTGALPTGLTVGVEYFVVNAMPGSFGVSATLGGAAIATSGSQSGIHTVLSSDFDLGEKGGAKTHTLSIAEMPSHTHRSPNTKLYVNSSALNEPVGGAGISTANFNSGATGGGAAHNNMPPYLSLNYLIKT